MQELSTPVKGKQTENANDGKKKGDGSISQSLAWLVTHAGLCVAKANQKEILC